MPTQKTAPAKAKKPAVKKAPVKAKAPAKKVAVKKTTKTVKRSSKKPAFMVYADDGECFWTTDGQVLHDLNDLQMALASMNDMVYGHHVNTLKNDFADWVEHVLFDAACAADLRASKKSSQARTVVVRHLRAYSV